MPATQAAQLDILQLFFENADWANVGDLAGILGAATPGSFYVSLHTESPGATGDQSTNEIAYTGYTRPAVARSTSGWTAASGSPSATVKNDAAITFGARSGGGTPTAQAWGIGSSGTPAAAGNLFFYGTLSQPLLIDGTVNPQFAIDALVVSLT